MISVRCLQLLGRVKACVGHGLEKAAGHHKSNSARQGPAYALDLVPAASYVTTSEYNNGCHNDKLVMLTSLSFLTKFLCTESEYLHVVDMVAQQDGWLQGQSAFHSRRTLWMCLTWSSCVSSIPRDHCSQMSMHQRFLQHMHHTLRLLLQRKGLPRHSSTVVNLPCKIVQVVYKRKQNAATQMLLSYVDGAMIHNMLFINCGALGLPQQWI